MAGSRSANTSGAGGLKGPAFLLFDDWATLGHDPGGDVWSRANKLSDIYIKIVIIFGDDPDPEYTEKLEEVTDLIREMREKMEKFNAIEGSQKAHNDFWSLLGEIQLKLWWFTDESGEISGGGMMDMVVPTRLQK